MEQNSTHVRLHFFLFHFFIFLLLDIFLIYISNVILFPGFPSGSPLSHPSSPCFYEGAPLATHSLPPTCPGIPLHWGIEPSHDQGPHLPLMPNKAILCYIWGWGLSGDSYIRLLSACTSWHQQYCLGLLAVCIWGRSPGGAVSEWPFLQSLLQTLSLYLLLWIFLFLLLRRTEVSALWLSFF